MEVNKFRLKRCEDDGNYFEKLFADKVKQKGLSWKKASQEDDWYKHIDCYVNEFGVDVKGNRHLNTIWLEYTNVNGNLGWLRGQAKYIAMHIDELDCFSIYYRSDLLTFVENNVFEKTKDKHDYLKLYTRVKWNKKDQLVKVKYEHIKHLEIAQL